MSLFKKRKLQADKPPASDGERRQLTVLFYDIVGSTSLAEADDPEDLRGALEQIHITARVVLTEHGGSLEQVMGDGGMAYFGYPVSSEDAALQAVEAAMALMEARQGIANAPPLRIGIATSVVVLPDSPDALSGGKLGAVGVAPNLAARLESAARAGEILVGQTTQALTARGVDFRPVDGLDLKGFPDVTRAWMPTGPSETRSRFLRDRDGSSPFTGRQGALGQLQAAWDRASQGHGAALLIEGEPGIGKSRLASEALTLVRGARQVLLQCQPRTRDEALSAFIRMYDHAYDRDDDPALSAAAERTAEAIGALEDDETLSVAARRDAIVAAVVTELEALAATGPLAILAEDLHWADEVTLSVLERVAGRSQDRPLLLIGTARPDPALEATREVWHGLMLDPIGPDEARVLVDAMARAPLGAATQDWIVHRADGNPLFLIELTAHVCEQMDETGKVQETSGAEVSTLRDLLATRLETAGHAKRMAQIASVIGREYPYRLLGRLAAAPRDALDADLQRLQEHGLHDPIENGQAYSFRHALVRDVAYDSQLRAVRRRLHGQIVDLLDSDPALGADVPEIVLAEHCLAAGRIARGLDLLLGVAEDAIRRSALRAPRAMLERVLDLAGSLDAGPPRDLLQLRAVTLLGPLVTLMDGPRASAHLYDLGQALYFALPLDERHAFFPVLWGWWFTASDLVEQTRRSEVLIRDVPPEADPESRLQALHCGWATLFDSGAHDRCLTAISDGLTLYDEEEGRKSRYLYGHDARVCGLGERALCGWLTGRIEDSQSAIQACEAWADETGHLSSQLHALDIATQVAFFRGDLLEIERILARLAALSGADAAPAITAKRQIFTGWMAVRAGDSGPAEQVMEGLRQLRAFGVLEDTPFYADIAATVTAASASPEAALRPLEEEILEARNTGLTYWLPELLRRKAVLTGGAAAADALDEGFALAQAQGARMLCLRNMGTGLDLGQPRDPRTVQAMQEMLPHISDIPLRQRVLDALAR